MPPTSTKRSDFLRRLAYFAIGLAIGLVMLGFFQQARRAEMARQQQERSARDAADAATLPPPSQDSTNPASAKPRGSP